MNPSYSRPVSLGPLLSQPALLVYDMLHTCELFLSSGKTFQLNLGNMSLPSVVPDMMWGLDELKKALIEEFPHLETEEGEGL